MQIIVAVLALVGGFILVGMTIAPSQPAVRDWYIVNACPMLDRISVDICAPVRRAAQVKPT